MERRYFSVGPFCTPDTWRVFLNILRSSLFLCEHDYTIYLIDVEGEHFLHISVKAESACSQIQRCVDVSNGLRISVANALTESDVVIAGPWSTEMDPKQKQIGWQVNLVRVLEGNPSSHIYYYHGKSNQELLFFAKHLRCKYGISKIPADSAKTIRMLTAKIRAKEAYLFDLAHYHPKQLDEVLDAIEQVKIGHFFTDSGHEVVMPSPHVIVIGSRPLHERSSFCHWITQDVDEMSEPEENVAVPEPVPVPVLTAPSRKRQRIQAPTP